MDLVYLVRRGDRNDELRYSLRSLTNFPHDRVWIVGHLPKWLTGVGFIPGNRHRSKPLNIFDNLRLACEHVTAERFVLMNDDFFVMEPVEGAPSWHRGTLREHLACIPRPSEWQTSLRTTLQWLNDRGIDDPLSYAVHAPMEFDTAKLAAVLDDAAGPTIPPGARSIYGNVYAVPSEQVPDCKVRRTPGWTMTGAFVSTDDGLFHRHPIGRTIRDTFPDPSEYERSPDGSRRTRTATR